MSNIYSCKSTSTCTCIISKTKCSICQNVYDTKIPNFKCPVHTFKIWKEQNVRDVGIKLNLKNPKFLQ